jgi:hypothetical protein
MKKIEYSESDIVSILKDINEFVVSLDQMDSVYHEFDEQAWKDEMIDYLITKKVFGRLANIRTKLSAPFPTDLGDDDMGFLEREMEDVDYWTYKSYLQKTKAKK